MSPASLQRLLFYGAAITAWGVEFGGLRLSGWTWFLLTLVMGVELRLRHLRWNAAASLCAFILFGVGWILWARDFRTVTLQEFVQLSAPILAFFLGYGAYESAKQREQVIEVPVLVTSLTVIYMALAVQVLTGWKVLSQRPAAITAIALGGAFIGIAMQGRHRAWLGWGACVALCVATGGRMAGLALLSMVYATPSAFFSFGRRIAVAIAVLAVVAAGINSEAFRRRFFYDPQFVARYGVIESFERGQLNTAGRLTAWNVLWKGVQEAPWLGHGGHTATIASLEVSKAMSHPHNDYLRIVYNYGILGTVLYWAFFVRRFVQAFRVAAAARKLNLGAGPRRDFAVLSSQICAMLSGFFLIAITDNPILYTAIFMFPLMYMLGIWQNQFERLERRTSGGEARPP